MQIHTKVILLGDVEIKVYSIAYLAAKLHRRPSAIRKWEWLGVVPKPILKTGDGRRWYTQEEVDTYVMVAEEENIRAGANFKKTKFTERIFGEINLLRKKFEEETTNV